MRSAAKTTRREFLGRSAAIGGAALAAPTVLSSQVFGANEKVGIGVIGPGRRGRSLWGWAGGLAQLVAAADVNLPRAEKAVKGKSDCAYQDYRKMLERDDVDGVLVGTPDHWHAICSIHACEAGKDVYVEKPMTLTIREGRLMVEAARKHKRVVQCGSQQRSMPTNRRGCELIRNGVLGTIKKVIAHNYPSPWNCGLPGGTAPKGLDWDMWCGPTELRPYHKHIYAPRAHPGWISFRTWSGGEMTGWGAHGLDQVQWALGMDDSGPIEVWTEGGEFDPPTYTKPEGRGRGDKQCSKPKVMMRYPGDIVMELGNGPHGGAHFIGEKGKMSIGRASCKSDPRELANTRLKDPEVKLTVSNNHMANWLECIKTRKRPIADVEIGHRSSTVCHLGNIARWLAPQKLTWDPEAERFGQDEANALLDRKRRKPYTL
jgi:predicted dehydrogenase